MSEATDPFDVFWADADELPAAIRGGDSGR